MIFSGEPRVQISIRIFKTYCKQLIQASFESPSHTFLIQLDLLMFNVSLFNFFPFITEFPYVFFDFLAKHIFFSRKTKLYECTGSVSDIPSSCKKIDVSLCGENQKFFRLRQPLTPE